MPVRVDDDELISLTDMHKASGGKRKHEPSLFLSNQKTAEFVEALKSTTGNPVVKRINGGRSPGTWGCKFLAYEYAGWIDPNFKIGVYTVLDKFFAGQLQPVTPMDELNRFVLECRVSQQLGSFHGKGLSARKQEKAKLEQREVELIARLQLRFPSIEQALIS